jgi:hypothetical protein
LVLVVDPLNILNDLESGGSIVASPRLSWHWRTANRLTQCTLLIAIGVWATTVSGDAILQALGVSVVLIALVLAALIYFASLRATDKETQRAIKFETSIFSLLLMLGCAGTYVVLGDTTLAFISLALAAGAVFRIAYHSRTYTKLRTGG